MNKTSVKFEWGDGICADAYNLTVKNTTTGAKVTTTVIKSKVTVTPAHGKQKWFVRACNRDGYTKSKPGKFSN